MKIYFPGTVVERNNKSSREFLSGLFFATKGLMLAQVREITGLDKTTIQNWSNRGWIRKTVDKRYAIDNLAGIMLINMLRDVMKIESIVSLFSYINGDIDDESDNIVSESDLYNYICDILDIAEFKTLFDDKNLSRLINNEISDYHEPFEGAKDKLVNAIKIILVYYASAIIKREADKIYSNIIIKGEK